MKAFVLSLGCVLAWFVLLPIVLVGGGIALFVYAASAELAQVVSGTSDKRLDASTARAMAARICFGGRRMPLNRMALNRLPR